MINKQLETDIIKTIEKVDGFNAQDFDLTSSDISKSNTKMTELRIDMYGTDYNLVAEIPHRRSSVKKEYDRECQEFSINIICNPGELIDAERQNVFGKSDLLKRINIWCEAIKTNIDSTYTHRKIEEQRVMISNLIEGLQANDDYFTPDEAVKLREELESQQNKFHQDLKKQFEISEELEQQLKNLKNDFEELEKRIFTQTKRGWLRSWAGRIFKWSANPENQQLMLEASKTVKSILGDGNPE